MTIKRPRPDMISIWESDPRVLRGEDEVRYVHQTRVWIMEPYFLTPRLQGGAIFRRDKSLAADSLPWGWLVYDETGKGKVFGATATIGEAVDNLRAYYRVKEGDE